MSNRCSRWISGCGRRHRARSRTRPEYHVTRGVDVMAGGADEFDTDLGPTFSVQRGHRRTHRIRQVAVAPSTNRHHYRKHIESHWGETVFVALALAGLLIRSADKQTHLTEPGQAI